MNGLAAKPRVILALATKVATLTRTLIGTLYLVGTITIAVAIGSVLTATYPPGPAPVAAFSVIPDASNSVVLNWTAPGDDGVSGTISQYDIRYSLSTITEANWNLAVPVVGEPAPLPAGTAQSMTVTGLLPETTYFFALKSADEVPNWSALSTVVQKTTSAVVPVVCLEDWSCTGWGICGSDGTQSRTCTDVNACGTTAFKPAESQSCTPAVTPPVPCTEDWSCTSWSACSASGTQTRTCRDLNACGTTVQLPATTFACFAPPPPPISLQPVPTDPPPVEFLISRPPDVGNRSTRAHIVVAPAKPGAFSLRVFSPAGQLQLAFRPFGATLRGLSVANGDVDGDGVTDLIVGQASGPNREVRVFGSNGRLKYRFLGLLPGIGSGMVLTAGDLNGDGRDDIVVAPATGRSLVSAYTYSPSRKQFFLLDRFLAFSPRFTGGLSLGAGDLTNDGADEVLVSQGLNGNGLVRILRYDTATSRLVAVRQFQPYGTRFHQDISVAVGEVTADGTPDILTVPGPGSGPLVRVLTPSGSLQKEFYAGGRDFRGGVRVASTDTNADGVAEVVTATYGRGDSGVRIFRWMNRQFVRTSNFAVFDANYRNGLALSAYAE
jgi:hypothetical protein